MSTLTGMDKLGISSLSDVQRALLDEYDLHRDILVQSRAGTGKSTGIGILINEKYRVPGVSIILVPSSVLSAQLEIDLKLLLSNTLCVVQRLTDPSDGDEKITILNREHLVLIAEAQVLASCLHRARFVSVSNLIFDEADELFDSDLIESSREIIGSCLREDTHTVFFSATFPPFIVSRIEESIAAVDETRDEPPHHIKLCVSTSTDSALNAVVPHVKQNYIIAPDTRLPPVLCNLIHSLLSEGYRRGVVFGGSIELMESIAKSLNPVTSSILRRKCLLKPIDGTIILDPKSFLSRGVNIPGLDFGICIGIPLDKETVIHQWGRIAREGHEGQFYHIVKSEDIDQLNFLSFQLGVEFREYIPASSKEDARHPFEIHSSTDDRLRHIIHILERVK